MDSYSELYSALCTRSALCMVLGISIHEQSRSTGCSQPPGGGQATSIQQDFYHELPLGPTSKTKGCTGKDSLIKNP